MTGVAFTQGPSEAVGLPWGWRVRTLRLEFGPSRSLHDLCRALGNALARSRLTANRVELIPTPDGYLLYADCDAADAAGAVLDVLGRLIDEPAP